MTRSMDLILPKTRSAADAAKIVQAKTNSTDYGPREY